MSLYLYDIVTPRVYRGLDKRRYPCRLWGMDMEIIDSISADSLIEGDTIRFDGEEFNRGSLQEILKIRDDVEDVVILFLEDDGEVEIHPDLFVDLYGYTVEEI